MGRRQWADRDTRLIRAECSCCFGSPGVHLTLYKHGRWIDLSRLKQACTTLACTVWRSCCDEPGREAAVVGILSRPTGSPRNLEVGATHQVRLAEFTNITTDESWLGQGAIIDVHAARSSVRPFDRSCMPRSPGPRSRWLSSASDLRSVDPSNLPRIQECCGGLWLGLWPRPFFES